MTNYGIFELLYSNLRHKLEADNWVFTQKCTVGWQQIRIHCLKDENLDIIECLESQNKLQVRINFRLNTAIVCSGPVFIFPFSRHMTTLLWSVLEWKQRRGVNELKFLSFSCFLIKTCALKKNIPSQTIIFITVGSTRVHTQCFHKLFCLLHFC